MANKEIKFVLKPNIYSHVKIMRFLEGYKRDRSQVIIDALNMYIDAMNGGAAPVISVIPEVPESDNIEEKEQLQQETPKITPEVEISLDDEYPDEEEVEDKTVAALLAAQMGVMYD